MLCACVCVYATDYINYLSAQVVEPEEMKETTGLSIPHTSHCLGNGDIMISAMGDPNGNAKG